jgi:hypothetical protein
MLFLFEHHANDVLMALATQDPEVRVRRATRAGV